ncbi:SURF1 family protein [Pseudovibrio exalbescens]|uniref:SURF1 family protein n=1 Tax=Pseudovibrio exalbescens TaxID=197461 RepID=UPI0023661D2A|nr:SURF1 family protein [Pseudovibrio exalbescens]MDD7911295.1 SURF1 family protein [Pseudovibrio exalbescens]
MKIKWPWKKAEDSPPEKEVDGEEDLEFRPLPDEDDEELELPVTPKGKPFYLQYLWLTLFTLVAFGVLLSLGFWQLDRLAWKEALIERATERVTDKAVVAPGPKEWKQLTTEEIDYLPVTLKGRFILGELYYFDTLNNPRGRYGGQGYFVYTPFATNEGWVVLVNRGFVPIDRRDQSTRLGSAPPKETIILTGLARRAETPSFFSPAGDEHTGEWFVREPKKMAEALGLDASRTAPYTVDINELTASAGDLPQPGETRLTFSNNHLQYAFTWFGLAATLIAMYIAFRISMWRKSKKPAPVVGDEDEDDWDLPPPDVEDRPIRDPKAELEAEFQNIKNSKKL